MKEVSAAWRRGKIAQTKAIAMAGQEAGRKRFKPSKILLHQRLG
jgi:hypothetical protein